MKTVRVNRSQQRLLQSLSRKDINLLKKHPKIFPQSRELLRACRKVIKRVEMIPEYASRRKRQTAYRRVIAICQKAIDRFES
jgi:hypothetical protein